MLDHYTTGLTFTLIVIVTCSISIIFKCKVGITESSAHFAAPVSRHACLKKKSSEENGAVCSD